MKSLIKDFSFSRTLMNSKTKSHADLLEHKQTKIYKQSKLEQVKVNQLKLIRAKQTKQIKPFIYVQEKQNQNH